MSITRHIAHHGQQVPTLVYGTAWKEEATSTCVTAALQAGFLGIDTANQRKHYFEAAVGDSVQQAIQAGQITRNQLFLQTKFTFQAGQDHRLPYNPQADYTTQVQQSFASSLEHLHTDYLDSYVLHGPSTGQGLTAADIEVWRAMEALQRSGSVRQLGVSNVNAAQLQRLLEVAEIPPVFVQNRCYARTQWDVQVRQLCQQHQMLYQGFSLLTANARELNHPAVFAMAERLQATLPQVVFRFALQLGMQPLTGTTNPAHMAQDLAVYDLPALSDAEMHSLEQIAF